MTGSGTGLYELGASDTQFDITQSGTTTTYTYDGTGTDPDITNLLKINDQLQIAAQNFASGNNGDFTITEVGTNYFKVTNASGSTESDKTIGTGYIILLTGNVSTTQAEQCLFIVDGVDDNRYIAIDGVTVRTSDDATGHLYGSPKAKKIVYYKDKLYLCDYTVGTSSPTRYKNGIVQSSVPLGIVSLVDTDHTAPVTSLKVTDTKYIQANDTLDIYRAGVFIGAITVTAKTQDTLTINSFSGNINSADEVWVANTYNGVRKFRWADNPRSGINVQQYDTFKLSGGDTSEITLAETIGDVLYFGNKKSLATWNDVSLVNFDLGIGCVSRTGSTKLLGTLFFVDYSGVYATTGGAPKLISAKVKPYFDGATKAGLEAAAMGHKGYSIFASIGNVTLYNIDGSTLKTLTDVVVEYDFKQQNWFVHTGIDANMFATFIHSTDVDRLEFMDESEVYEFLKTTGDNETTAIPLLATTHPITLAKEFEKICYPKEIVIETEKGSGVKCFISLDDDPFYEITGEAVKGATVLKVTPRNESVPTPRCRKIRISIREMSTRQIKISRISIIYTDTPEHENQR